MSDIKIMEVCGTHTMSIAKSGIKSILPDNVKLISGPGCPVCVTPSSSVDAFLKLSEKKDLIIATYGDMFKVPGSLRGDSLLLRKAGGALVEMVYSPMDAVALAEKEPDKEVVFLGVGFETTAPGTASAIKTAFEKGIKNFSVINLLKTIEPALRCLLKRDDLNVNGLLCPGHVAVILGEDGFRFLPEEFEMPSVISGFEPEEIMLALRMLLGQISNEKAVLENAYENVVRPEGNIKAREVIEEVFCAFKSSGNDNVTENNFYNDEWRGLGYIKGSGYCIRKEYEMYDAVKKFSIDFRPVREDPLCRCGDVICGMMDPFECPLFGKVCTPEDPVGPCMVSGEGSCAAAYIYR